MHTRLAHMVLLSLGKHDIELQSRCRPGCNGFGFPQADIRAAGTGLPVEARAVKTSVTSLSLPLAVRVAAACSHGQCRVVANAIFQLFFLYCKHPRFSDASSFDGANIIAHHEHVMYNEN